MGRVKGWVVRHGSGLNASKDVISHTFFILGSCSYIVSNALIIASVDFILGGSIGLIISALLFIAGGLVRIMVDSGRLTADPKNNRILWVLILAQSSVVIGLSVLVSGSILFYVDVVSGTTHTRTPAINALWFAGSAIFTVGLWVLAIVALYNLGIMDYFNSTKHERAQYFTQAWVAILFAIGALYFLSGSGAQLAANGARWGALFGDSLWIIGSVFFLLGAVHNLLVVLIYLATRNKNNNPTEDEP